MISRPMIRRSVIRKSMFALLAFVLVTPPLAAQTPLGWSVGASGAAGLFVGGSSDFLDAGLGFDVDISKRVVPKVSLRADGMVMTLDDDEGPGEAAGNRILLLGIGPQIDAPVGPTNFYLRGLAGAAVNQQSRTGSTVQEATSWTTALGAGAGIRLDLAPAVALDVGADVLKLGELDFARTAASGSTSSEDTALLRIRAGLRFGIG